MRSSIRSVPLLALTFTYIASSTAAAQKSKGVDGKTACGLLSADEIKRAAGRPDVARTTSHMDEDTDVSSSCQYWGAVDITLHIGKETKVMFGRMRDNYAKAPARLGYTVARVSGLGDEAYYLIYKGKAEVRALRGETELAVSLSGSLPSDMDAKKVALSVAKAALNKL
jgi:hypothetical protein